MDIKQLQTNLNRVKEQTAQVYKETMNLSVPYFILHKKLYEGGDAILKEQFKINQSELDILATLYYMSEENYSLTPTQLYESLMFSSGGMTKVLKNLEKKSYIKRVDNQVDKRSKLVQLTSEGINVTQLAIKSVVEYEDQYFSKLSTQEQEEFKTLLLKVIGS